MSCIYMWLNAYSLMGTMLYVWLHFGKRPCGNHTQPSGSLYSSEAALSSPQLPPPECCSCMNISDFASCVAHGSQVFYEVYSPKCPCAALDTSRKSEGRRLVDAVPLRVRIPAHPHSWGSVSLRPSQQVSCLWGREELPTAPWRQHKISSHSQKAPVPEAWRGLPGRVWCACTGLWYFRVRWD